MDVNELNYAVQRFIYEVSKKDHSFYPAETLYSLVVCLQACCQTRSHEYKFFDDPKFAAICNTLDNRMKELSAQGIVTKKKKNSQFPLLFRGRQNVA